MNEDQRFFDDCRSMFLSDGWKAFQAEIEVAINAIDISSLDSSEQFWQAKGQLETLRTIAGWENAILAAEHIEDEL